MPDVGPPEGDTEVDSLSAVLDQGFGRKPADAVRWRDRVEPKALRVVRRSGRVVGGLRIVRMGQWFAGRVVPMGGIASVAVAPEQRGTGAAASLMTSTLEELHADGFVLSVLFPAADGPYRRVGYERAGSYVGYRLPLRLMGELEPMLDIVRVESDGIGDLRAVYDARARTTAGNLDRDEGLNRNVFEDAYVYSADRGREIEGYVAFTQSREGDMRYDLRCRDLVATTPEAARSLLAFCAGHRSMARDLLFHGAPNEPLLYHVSEQEATVTQTWSWMSRIVDVRGALEARAYPAGLDADVHLDVRDDVLGWNEGRFVLEVGDGHGKVRKGGRGRLGIDVRGLAALYTGHLTTGELASVGLADGADPPADAVFAGPAPWMPDFF